MERERPVDVVVVGGGIIGLSIAWRARARGMSVTVLERGQTGAATSRVAAGMLAPVSELEFGDSGSRVLTLGLRSAQMWSGFASELEADSGVPVGVMHDGMLLLARDDDEARELERQLEFRRSLGLAVERLLPSEARAREPALAPVLRLALSVPDDRWVDPRAALSALRGACANRGVVVREHAAVARIELRGERVRGVALETGEQVPAAAVVIAAGSWSGAIDGLPEAARVPLRPVKGQILSLVDPAGPGLLRSVVRYQGGYLVPRADGRYACGGTVEEQGFRRAPTAGAVHDLLRHARELVPGVSELEIDELSVGFRPATPDNTPAIGPGALAGLVWATGHYRNGILLAPLTAEMVLEVLERDSSAPERDSGARSPELAGLLAKCDPARFVADVQPEPGSSPAEAVR